MSTNEVYELAVQMKPEGMDETEGKLDQVEGSFEDTSESVDQSAGEMEGFAQQWQGAMTAITTGLAVAAAGLLSQVPVIGELMSGLVAVIEAIAFQMDQVLRPVLQPLTDFFFHLSNAIFELDGPLGALVGVLGAVAAAFGIVLGIATVFGKQAVVLAAAKWALVAAGQALIGVLGSIAAALGLPVIAVAALAAAIAAAVAIILTDFMGIRSAIVDFISGAYQWGADLMMNFAQGIIDTASAPIQAAADVLDQILGIIGFDIRKNDKMAQRWGEDMLQHFSVGMDRGVKKNFKSEEVVQAEGGSGGNERGTERTQLFIDGREAEKGTRNHRDRPRKRRGRYG